MSKAPERDGGKGDARSEAPRDESESAAMSGEDMIGLHLRRFYSELQQEELPPRFLDLLQRLEQEERRAGDAGAAGEGCEEALNSADEEERRS